MGGLFFEEGSVKVYEFTYSIVMRSTVAAATIVEAAAHAHAVVRQVKDAKLLSVTQIDPPLNPVEPRKDAA